MRAYSELYIDEFQDNMGEMTDYVIEQCGVSPQEFWDRFLSSRVPGEIERGNPDYLVGKSGAELAHIVLGDTGYRRDAWSVYVWTNPGRSYWTGWALAYLQWYTGLSFKDLTEYGYGAAQLAGMYNPYHEADISRFVEDVSDSLRERMCHEPSRLKKYRLYAGITQKELSARTGVKLRMIQAYEQKYQDISKAEVGSLIALSAALHCSPADLVPPIW